MQQGQPLVYSTYLGGSLEDSGNAITVDESGNAYVTGETRSADFPTMSPFQASLGGTTAYDAFVTKLNATGSALVYSTFLGGEGDDISFSIAVDNEGNTYVTGETNSEDFPTKNPIQSTAAGGFGGDVFVTKLNAAGSAMLYSTLLGGRNGVIGLGRGLSIALDSSRNVYVTGMMGNVEPSDFPSTPGAFQTTCDSPCAFVTKLEFVEFSIIEYFPLQSGNQWISQINGGTTVTETVLDGTVFVNGIATKAIQDSDGIVSYYTNDENGLRLHRQFEPDVDLGDGVPRDFTVTYVPPLQ